MKNYIKENIVNNPNNLWPILFVALGSCIGILSVIHGDNFWKNMHIILTNKWFVCFNIFAYGINLYNILETHQMNDLIIIRTGNGQRFYETLQNKLFHSNILLFTFGMILVVIISMIFGNMNFELIETIHYYISEPTYIIWLILRMFLYLNMLSYVFLYAFEEQFKNFIYVVFIIFAIIVILIPTLFNNVNFDSITTIPWFIGYCFFDFEYSNFMLEIYSCSFHFLILTILYIALTERRKRSYL